MDYEKLYKEALERAREELGSGCFDRGTVEYIFPELKESEDERIRKCLKRLINGLTEEHFLRCGASVNEIHAWLEKQGEQKLVWSEEDEKMMHQLHSWMKEFGGAEEYTEKVYNWLQGLIEKQGKQKPLVRLVKNKQQKTS